MAITLTYGYQRISTIGTTYGEIRTYAKVNSQDKNLNKSYFNLKLTYYLRQWIEVSSANANVDGSTRGYGYTRFNGGETTILEVGREIQHNEDGSSPVKNVFSSWSASFGGGGSTSADIVMPKIDRLATVIRANDFTDEENPTMEFSNPVGFKVHPYLYFYKRGDYSKEVFGLTRKIDNAPTPYNWVITEEEREQIRNALNEATEYDVAIGLFTYNFENVCLGQTNLVRKFTIVDCEPLIELTCTEKNEKVKAITNNEYILVNNVSILNVEADLTLKKGANASKVLIQDVEVPSPYSTDLNITGQEETYVVNGKIIDSRQLDNSKNSPPYQLIDYRPVKIDNFDFKRENPTSSQIILNAEITYWQVTVNNVANVPIVSYSVDGEVFNAIPGENYSIDEESHKLRITNYNVPTPLDYREQGTYYLKIEDKFTIDDENQIITKGIPTFEAGENDFQINGTLYVADENRENRKAIKPVVDSLDGNETDQSPSVRAVKKSIKPVVLFTSDTGTQGSFSLSDNIKNYTKLEIVAGFREFHEVSIVYPNVSLTDSVILAFDWHDGTQAFGRFGSLYKLSGKTFTYQSSFRLYKYSHISTSTFDTNNAVWVYRVIGYK